MKLRYKKYPDIIRYSSCLNIHALFEVNMGDDSAYPSDLEVELDSGWKCLKKAFQDRDVITDNLNVNFGLPLNEECRERGYNP